MRSEREEMPTTPTPKPPNSRSRRPGPPKKAKGDRIPLHPLHRLNRLLRGVRDPSSGERKGGFETKAQARAEDEVRLRLLRKGIPLLGALQAQGQEGRARTRQLRKVRQAARPLQRALREAIRTGRPSPSLASKMHLRAQRLEVIGALLHAVENLPDPSLRTMTVINRQWAFSPAALDKVRASTIRQQFRTHLQRAGVLALPGLLVAVLHGEHEPTSGLFQLHFHLLTTVEKAAVLKKQLTGHWGYLKTATEAPPIVRKKVRDRPRQFSYLLQGFWPEKAVVLVNGQPKRRRTKQRIGEPYHSLNLLWLHRQELSEVMLLNQCRYRGAKLYVS